MEERRAYPRVTYECPVQLRALAPDEKFIVRNSFCQNISLIGLKIISFDFFSVGEKLRLKIFSPANICLMEMVAKIVWVHQYPYQHKYMFGLQFTDVGTTAHEKLTQLLNTAPGASQGRTYTN